MIKVSWRDPGQNGRFWASVLVRWNLSLQQNVEKLTFRCHVRPNRLKICMYDRMLGAVTLETPKPPQFQPELPKKQFLWKTRFFQLVFCQRWTSRVSCWCHYMSSAIITLDTGTSTALWTWAKSKRFPCFLAWALTRTRCNAAKFTSSQLNLQDLALEFKRELPGRPKFGWN